MLWNVALTLFFVFLNGFFVAAEFAFVKVRASQIEIRIREGNFFAGLAKHILDNLDAYLSASQLGITLASLGLGWIGESVVSTMVTDVLALLQISLDPVTLHTISIVIAFSIITVLHIVIGEQAPKTFAIRRPEAVTLAVALPIRVFFVVFRPVIGALNAMSNALLRAIGIQHTSEHDVHSPEELRYLIMESSSKGVLDISEQELIANVFQFSDTSVGQVMVPRSKIVSVDVSTSAEDLLNTIMDEGYSRLPVQKGSIDDVIGIVYAKDLLTMVHNSQLIILHDILHSAHFVSEDAKLKRVLADMQIHKVHIAIVLDEFGGTAGLITMEDIIEELVGNIQDEYDDEAPVVATTAANLFDLDASVHIDEANEILPSPLPESEDYDTIGGLINATAGRIPQQGDVIDLEVYMCTILTSSPRRVERVRLALKS